MTFFNKKNDVISIELTSYGKYLLSKGKFKPVYYEFLDDDILYDSSYAGVSEEQRNNISERIKNETPRIKTQYVFTGVETKLKQLKKIKVQLEKQRRNSKTEEELIENFEIFEKLHFNSSPLGTSNLDDKYPALNFSVYNAEILSSSLYQNYNSHVINVAEINLKNINVSSSILTASATDSSNLSNIEQNQFSLEEGVVSIPRQTTRIFPDNTYVSIEDKSVIFQFFEKNTKETAENFEIEIYTYETGSDGRETIKQLFFDNSNSEFVDDQNKVEYYFQILKDNNIRNEDLKNIQAITETVVFPTKK